MFIDDFEKDLADEFIEKGFVIRPVDNFDSLKWIKRFFRRGDPLNAFGGFQE